MGQVPLVDLNYYTGEYMADFPARESCTIDVTRIDAAPRRVRPLLWERAGRRRGRISRAIGAASWLMLGALAGWALLLAFKALMAVWLVLVSAISLPAWAIGRVIDGK